MTFRSESQTKTESGYEIRTRHYQCSNCKDCPLKPSRTKAKGNRSLQISLPYLRYKQQAREKLRSEAGYVPLAVRRMIEPESIFGQIKNNRVFRHFLLRGLSKVSLEVGWLSLAHNQLK
nr:transposase [Paenibacillus monticola]